MAPGYWIVHLRFDKIMNGYREGLVDRVSLQTKNLKVIYNEEGEVPCVEERKYDDDEIIWLKEVPKPIDVVKSPQSSPR